MIQNGNKQISRQSLGTWFFDKKSRKRKYISLSGLVYSGAEAMHKARQDQYHETHPAQVLRSELIYCAADAAASSSRDITDKVSEGFDEHLSRKIQLSTWGIPPKLVARYATCKIVNLFPWQVECLTVENGKVLSESKNLIYSAPTSGGKTLVAEILMLRKLATTMVLGNPKYIQRRTIMFVVPFVALAEEKYQYFQEVWKDLNLGIKCFHQGDVDNILGEDVEVAIVTIERANILFNQLLEENRESQLSMIVIDEIHLLSDRNRGFLLEVLLTKLKFLLKSSIQIIGMSATLPNIKDLAVWLDASLYVTSYRPVQLQLYVVEHCQLFKIHTPTKCPAFDTKVECRLEEQITYEFHSNIDIVEDDDPDGFKSIAFESVAKDISTLVFCNSKRRCEVCATIVAAALKARLSLVDRTSVEARQEIIRLLVESPVGLCPILENCIPFGVAYHHAGLSLDERNIIELGFRRGSIVLLCTTSTLSAGVNLPARRVIIRSLQLADQLISVASFRQMCGRAGRTGYDSIGEAIILLNAKISSQERCHMQNILFGDLDPLKSSLHLGCGGGIEKLLLEMVVSRRLCNETEVMNFVKCSLMSIQLPEDKVYEYVHAALTFLKANQFVLLLSTTTDDDKSCFNGIDPSNGTHLCSSPLGKAAVASGMSPTDAIEVLPSLFQARSKLILSSKLHVLYLLTPCNYSGIRENWSQYDQILTTLVQEYPPTQLVIEVLGIDRSFVDQCKFSTPNPRLAITKDWPMSKMKQLFQHISRGQTQVLLKDTAIFASMMKAFCDKLNWKSLSASFTDSISRLASGCQYAVLTKISDDLTLVRARLLWTNNIRSAEELMCCSVQQLADLFYSHLPYIGNSNFKRISENSDKSCGEITMNLSSCPFSYQSCVIIAEKLLVRAKLYWLEEIKRTQFFFL